MRSRRIQVHRVLEEQQALRRVATLVARGASPTETFWSVARELGCLLGADYATVVRFEPDQMAVHLANWHDPRVPAMDAPFGGRWSTREDALVAELSRTGRPVWRTVSSIGSQVGDWLQSQGVRETVACPVIVGGRLWGKMAVWFAGSRPTSGDIEARIGKFVEIMASTVAQAEYHAELISSQARLIDASDTARRRIERDLHDGTQPRLITLGLKLREAEERAAAVDAGLRELLSHAADDLSEVLTQLQEIIRGQYPAALAQEGLGAAIKTLARRFPVPTELCVTGERRLPRPIESTLYYVISEALANVLKYASASMVHLELFTDEEIAQLAIRDNGIGGADPQRGTGLIGLEDRVQALEGTLKISSPVGAGTSLLVTIPLHAARNN